MKPLAPIALTMLVFAAPAAAKSPDLVVKSGTAQLSGATVSGSFSVRNTGRRRSGATSAVLRLGTTDIATVPVHALAKNHSQKVTVTGQLPADLDGQTSALTACADPDNRVHERKEGNNCRVVGQATIPPPPATPSGPVSYQADQPVKLQSGKSSYWTIVPGAYSGAPVPLLVWLHGCGGEASGDIYTVAPTDGRTYIAIAVGGREDDCWDVNQDSAKVFAAIANVKTHFNVDPHRVVLGGYSSGGDLAYRTAFYNSTQFAGLLAENTAPFRDTGSTDQQSLAAATTKFHIVHLAHTEDDTYPIDTVRQETDELKGAGFPIQRVERPGEHYDDNTDADLQQLLLPHMTDGWTSP